MSRTYSPRKQSASKHRGMKTSLYNEKQEQNGQRIVNNIYNTTNPQRIFVQTVSEQPNVMPYINSGYSTQPQLVRPAQSQYLIVNERENNLMSTTMRPQAVSNIRVSPVVVQNLSRTKIQPAQYQSRISPNTVSTYVPPPPESFLIPNQTTKPMQSKSLNKTVVQSVPVTTIIPPQIVKKTFVPHHIINQIPVYTGPVYTESGYRQRSQQKDSQYQGNNDESQQVLMGYYEKLYTKYEQQKQRSATINQQLLQAMGEINHLKSELESKYLNVQENIQQKPQKKRIIDKKRLHNLLMSKWSPIIDQVVERRKQNCMRQVSSLVESQKVTIKIPGQFKQHQSTYSYYPR